MKKELTLLETLELEIEFAERKHDHALSAGKPIEEVQTIQKEIEYLKITLEKIQERYNTAEPIRKRS